MQNTHHRHLWYDSEVPHGPNKGFGGRLNVMRRVVCTESSGSTEATGGIDSIAEGCVKGACVVSCSCTDISSSALTRRLGGTKSRPTRDVASGRCGQKEPPLLGYRVLRGSQRVISSSQASSGASVCVMRSRNVLCGKRLTRSWKMMASVSATLHNLFSDSERERRCCTARRNKRSTLCDPDNTFHTNAFSSRFSFLKQHTCRPKEHTTFHSRTL